MTRAATICVMPLPHGLVSLRNIDNIEALVRQVRTSEWERRKSFYEAKYPNRQRSSKANVTPAIDDIDNAADGRLSLAGGTSLHIASTSKSLVLPPSSAKPFRMTVALPATADGSWSMVEEPLSWTTLTQSDRRGRLPWRTRRLATFFCKTKSQLDKIRHAWSGDLAHGGDDD